MDVIDYVVNTINLVTTLYIQCLCYEKITDKKLDIFKLKYIIILSIMVLLSLINATYNITFSRLIVNFIIINITFLVLFKENPIDCLVKSLFCFLLLSIIEILLSITIFPFFSNITEFVSSSFFRFLFSVLNCILLYLLLRLSIFKRIIAYLVNKTSSIKFKVFILFIVLIISFLLSHKYALYDYDIELYLINFGLVVCFSLLLYFILYSNYKIKIIKNEYEVILNFMNNYEKLIDEHRIKLHEIHNDLLVLKSFKNKNNLRFNEMLIELIDKYSKNGISYKNLNELPNGLKGIIYYKLYEMKELGIEANIFISKKCINAFENNFDSKYVLLTKIFCILLDNAKDASCNSNEKIVNIIFENIEEYINVRIENSYVEKPDISKIYNKGYSNKGKFRGYGLYILKTLINKHENIELNQFIEDDIFVSELKINKNVNK